MSVVRAIIGKALATVGNALYKDGIVYRSYCGHYKHLRLEMSPQLREHPRLVGVFFRGGYERPVQRFLKSNTKPGDRVIVVGAHIGLHVLPLARWVGDAGHVMAFEPFPDNFVQLCRNIEVNNLKNVTVRQKAVSSSCGPVAMIQGPTSGMHRIADGDRSSGIIVESTTLDDELAGERVDLILIDVEGHELEVLKGATRVIREQRPIIVLEHHGDHRARRLTEWLKQHRYASEPLHDRHLVARPR